MINTTKMNPEMLNRQVRHDFSMEIGKVTKIREDTTGHCYFVEWELYPEHNDWYKNDVLMMLSGVNHE